MTSKLGALTALIAFAILAGPTTASALDVYVTDNSPNGIIYQLTGAPNGELLPKQPAKVQSGGQYPNSLALSADGRSLYVVNAFSGNVGQFWIKADGSLMPNDPPTAPAGARPQSIALSPDGRNAYVTNAGPATISVFRIDDDGRLIPKAEVPGGSDPSGIAISPDGQYAYVTNYHSRTISQFVITRSGKLVLNDPPVVGAAEFPRAIVASPAGSVYVVNEYSDAIGQYTIGPGGGLVPKTPTLVGTGQKPSAIAITADGKNAYVSNLGRPGGVSQYSVGANGGLTAKSPAHRLERRLRRDRGQPGRREHLHRRRVLLRIAVLARRRRWADPRPAHADRDLPQGDRRPRLQVGPPVGPTARENATQPIARDRQADRHRRPQRAAEAGRQGRRASPQACAGRPIGCAVIRPRGSKLHELGRQGWVDVQVTVELDPKRGEPTRRSRDVRLLLVGD